MNSQKVSFLTEMKAEYSLLTRPQKWLYCLYAFLLISRVLDLFRAIENRIGLGFFTEINNAFFITLAVIGSFTIFLKKLRFWDILFVLALGLYHQLGISLHPQTAQYAIENADLFLWTCLPMYLVGRTMDGKTSPVIFVALSYLALFMQILFLYVLGVEENEYGDIELMSTAYGFLPFVLFLIWYAFERKGLWNTAIALLSVFLLLSMGTRGPVMCMVVFVALYLIVFRQMHIAYKVLLCACAIILNSFMSEIMLLLSIVTKSLGLSTRVFDSFMQGQVVNLQESSGRDILWGESWDYIMSHNRFWGDGFYTERLANSQGWYSHNLEIDLLCDFGLIGGTIIFAILLWLMYKSVRNTWHTKGVIIFLVFFCSSFMYLQFSSTFLQASVFWLFLGICVTFASSKPISH